MARVAVGMGIEKIRLTGGEPLLRQELEKLVERLASIPGLRDLAMTSNGFWFRRKGKALRDAESARAVARSMPAGATTAEETPLGLDWPREIFSLSHVALPFPLTDGLYGLSPDPADAVGVNLGALAPRGETGLLVVGLESLMRGSSNPFFPWMRARIEATIPPR